MEDSEARSHTPMMQQYLRLGWLQVRTGSYAGSDAAVPAVRSSNPIGQQAFQPIRRRSLLIQPPAASKLLPCRLRKPLSAPVGILRSVERAAAVWIAASLSNLLQPKQQHPQHAVALGHDVVRLIQCVPAAYADLAALHQGFDPWAKVGFSHFFHPGTFPRLTAPTVAPAMLP